MDKYISQDTAVKAVCGDCEYNATQDCEDCRMNRLRQLPAADVVEVVRCKDCRYYYKDDDGYEMCDNSEGYDHISADGYCAWAVRRADNG